MFSGHSLGDGRGETVTVCTQRGGRWLAFCPRPHVLRRAASFPGQPRVQTHTNRLCLQTLFQQPVSIHGFDTFTPVYSNNLYEQQFPGPSFGGGVGQPLRFPRVYFRREGRCCDAGNGQAQGLSESDPLGARRSQSRSHPGPELAGDACGLKFLLLEICSQQGVCDGLSCVPHLRRWEPEPPRTLGHDWTWSRALRRGPSSQ